MRVNILVTKWNGTEELLKFDANNRLIKDYENFCKNMELKQVIENITNSIINDNREFRIFEVMGVHA